MTRGQMATFLRRAYDLAEGTQGFCDTAGHVHEPGIKAVAQAGIAQGSGGCYRPNEPVTRGQMATLLTRAEQLTGDGGPGFCDTAGHVHEPGIKAVAQSGIARGSGGCYRPDEPVTRGQMASFLAQALGL